MIECPLKELADHFRQHATEFAEFREKWDKEHPEILTDGKYFNLPSALYTMASEILKLKEKSPS